MKRQRLILITTTSSLLLLLIAAAVALWLTYPATLRNVYEDSWWIDTPHKSTYTAWPRFDSNLEGVYRMEQLAEAREWRELLPVARQLMHDNMRSADDEQRAVAALAVRYALLAESCLGTLPYNITLYPVSQPEDFLLFRVRDRNACLFNMFFFRELGLPDEVFHQAMEYPLSFAPCTHRALRLMTEAAAQSHDPLVAKKLQHIASQSPINTQNNPQSPDNSQQSTATPQQPTINYQLSTINSPTRSACHKQELPNRTNIFIQGDPMLNVFVMMLNEDSTNRRLVDYAALSFIMMGRKDRCHQLLRMCPVYDPHSLPPIYQ